MSRESTPVRFQREYSVWDAVANKEITSSDVDARGQVDVDEQMGRIFGTGRGQSPMRLPGTPGSPRPQISPRAPQARLQPILAHSGSAPFQRQVKPRLPSSHPSPSRPPAATSDPAIKLLGDEIRVLEERNRALYKRVVVQNKLIVGFCEHEVMRAGSENRGTPTRAPTR
jgi:hypothetical protein